MAVLAGNHDVWRDRSLDIGSEQLFTEVLPRVCTDLGALWLEGACCRLGDVSVVGSMAWYDYSAIDPQQKGPGAEQIAASKRFFNNDANWIDWPHSDLEVAASLAGPLLAQLRAAEAAPEVRAVAVVTHVPVLDAQMARKPHDPAWGFSNAFFGNLTLGEQILRFPKVSAVLSGHTHIGREGSLARPPLPPVRYRVVPSDYGEPRHVMIEV